MGVNDGVRCGGRDWFRCTADERTDRKTSGRAISGVDMDLDLNLAVVVEQ